MSRRSALLRPFPARLWAALLLLLLPAGAAAPAMPAESAETGGYALLERLTSPLGEERREAARQLAAAGDAALVPGIVDAYFFLPKNQRAEALSVLVALSGERPGERYHDWVDLVGRRPDLAARPGYLAWKGALLARIDPRYPALLPEGAPLRIRAEEVVWGGVPVEGIPALDQPAHVPAAQADWLTPGERVFGVSLGGETRAYPLRILDWHEMVNDTVGGEPVTLSYCTLCGSGVLYSTRTAPGESYTFGTSGLLYRSNKLMLDRQTRSLWSNLTGEAVIGPLAAGPARLAVLPLTLTTWREWRQRHPETTVLALDREAERRFGFQYQPGAAERKRAGVSFPPGPRSAALPPKAEVYAVRLDGRAKAYPLAEVLAERVVNDRLGGGPAGIAVVVIADPDSGAVRAYRRGEHTFAPGRAGEVVDGEGRRWSVGEDALLPVAGGPTLAPLPRLPGHLAFWSGWYSFFPSAELYGSPPR
ncbi:MAG TPA: DUF3179 domain-containing protein [Thermoanaerobaculia bacterium]|nr:DUF3179 domain-containing protein [Thermoanaerobaculia bacterium]